MRVTEKEKATNVEALTDIRDREVENAPALASSNEAAFWPIKFPLGMKFTTF